MDNEIKLFKENKILLMWDNEKEVNKLATICSQLKMKAMRNTDVADMQGIFSIIQFVPSPKVELFRSS